MHRSIASRIEDRASKGLLAPSLALSFAMASIVVWNGLIFRMRAFETISLGFAPLSQPRSDAPWLSALLAMAVVCLAVAVFERRREGVGRRFGKGAKAQRPPTKAGRSLVKEDTLLDTRLLTIGALLMLAGGTGLAFLGDDALPCVLFGTLGGAGLALLLCSWMPVATRAALDDLFMGGAASFLIAACVFAALCLIPADWSRVVLCALPLAAAVAIRYSLSDDWLFRDGSKEGSDPQSGSLFQVVCFCMLGFAFFMGILGFDFDVLPSDELLFRQSFTMAAAAVLACLVMLSLRRLDAMEYLSLVNPPLLATALVLLPLADSAWFVRMGILLAQASLFLSFVLVALSLRARRSDDDVLRRLALVLGVSSAVTILGILAGGVVRNVFGLDTAAIALTALFALYFIFLMFVLSLRRRNAAGQVVEHVISGPVMDAAALARVRAEVIAARYPQISKRERDVLELLLQNYSNARIAEALTVSENTVKTHVRHIYARLDLNSRQQLLALAESIPVREAESQAQERKS